MKGRDRDAALAMGAALLGAVVAGALFYEGAVFSLSITGRAVVLVVFLVGLVVLAMGYPAGTGIGIVAMVASLVTGIYGGYAIGYPGPVGAIAALAVMAAVSVVFYLVQEGRLFISRRAVHVVGVVLLLGTVAFVGVDLQYGEVTYDVSLEDRVTVPSDPTAVTVGRVTAANSYLFREPANYPDVRACLYADGGRQDLGYLYGTSTSFFGQTVPGDGTRTAPLQVLFSLDQIDTMSGALPVVRRSACPAERDADGIVIVVQPDGSGSE